MTDDSVFQKGVPYASHQKSKNHKDENVIYIPSSQEEFDAEISRLDCNTINTYNGAMAPKEAAKFHQSNMPFGSEAYNELLDSFMFSVHVTKGAKISTSKRKVERSATATFKTHGNEVKSKLKQLMNTKESETKDNEISRHPNVDRKAWGEASRHWCAENYPREDIEETALASMNQSPCNYDRNEAGTVGNRQDLGSLKAQVNDKVQNNFVEINILSLDTTDDTEASLNDSTTKSLEITKCRKPLREIVRELIKDVFKSPHRDLKYSSLKSKRENKHKEVKISVDDLYKDKFDFIVDENKPECNLITIFSSKKFLFLQLCVLVVFGVYFMSFYNASHPIRFEK